MEEKYNIVCAPQIGVNDESITLTIEEAKNYWGRITNECIKQGFSLGFDLELPSLINQKYDEIEFKH